MSRVLMVSSEATPFAKTGGLADVVGALPIALQGLGHEVAVVLPRYGSIPLDNAREVWLDLTIHLGPHTISCDLYEQVHRGIRYFFVDCPWLFDRAGGFYAHSDNHLRFAAFCQAVLGLMRFVFRPDVLHLHDWQSALCAPYIRTRFATDPTFLGMPIVFTIHNLEHQGRFGPHVFTELGLDSWLFRPDILEFFGDVNFMKGAILFSDAITTVSPKYAAEIQTPEFGFGLDGLLRSQTGRLRGILNGVDYADWDPATDKLIAAHYSPADLTGKRACKQDLLTSLGLPLDNMERPVLGLVTRLARQKGIDIFREIAWRLLADDVCLTVVASGDPEYEHMLRELAGTFPGRVAGYIGFDNALAHKVEAGADIFLMPSRFEPCGLNQIYSLKYGTVPVVRATGGLDDTVDGETGFKFWGYWPGDFLTAVRLAIAEWKQPQKWRARMLAGMSRDFSWEASARQYSDLYAELRARQ